VVSCVNIEPSKGKGITTATADISASEIPAPDTPMVTANGNVHSVNATSGIQGCLIGTMVIHQGSSMFNQIKWSIESWEIKVGR
jgi:hypothetical protein